MEEIVQEMMDRDILLHKAMLEHAEIQHKVLEEILDTVRYIKSNIEQ